jgi:hypothetical protein
MIPDEIRIFMASISLVLLLMCLFGVIFFVLTGCTVRINYNDIRCNEVEIVDDHEKPNLLKE